MLKFAFLDEMEQQFVSFFGIIASVPLQEQFFLFFCGFFTGAVILVKLDLFFPMFSQHVKPCFIIHHLVTHFHLYETYFFTEGIYAHADSVTPAGRP